MIGKTNSIFVGGDDPKEAPVYTYSGDYQYIDDGITEDGVQNWRIKLYTNGNFVFKQLNSAKNGIDVFLVGGGGGSSGTYAVGERGACGGGGYTTTATSVAVTKDTTYTVAIGAGGGAGGYRGNGGNGGATSAFGYTADSGKGGIYSSGYGGNGGSGGNAYGSYAGRAVDGADGASVGSYAGGTGQHTTTREFAETSGDLYASGGGFATLSQPNTGDGGASRNDAAVGANGYSGIVIIRNHREVSA